MKKSRFFDSGRAKNRFSDQFYPPFFNESVPIIRRCFGFRPHDSVFGTRHPPQTPQVIALYIYARVRAHRNGRHKITFDSVARAQNRNFVFSIGAFL